MFFCFFLWQPEEIGMNLKYNALISNYLQKLSEILTQNILKFVLNHCKLQR